MMQKSPTYYFHYDFSCKKVLPTFTTILRVKKCHFNYDVQNLFGFNFDQILEKIETWVVLI
jgi:hypothetical protein